MAATSNSDDFTATVLIGGQRAKQLSPSQVGNHKVYYMESVQGKTFEVEVGINNQSLFESESGIVEYTCQIYIDGNWQSGRCLKSPHRTLVSGTRVSATELRTFVFAKAPVYEPEMDSNITADVSKHGSVGMIQVEFYSGKRGAPCKIKRSIYTSARPVIKKNILANHSTQLGETAPAPSRTRIAFKKNDAENPDFIITIHYCSREMLQAREIIPCDEIN